ncbi:uncharacterized protein LOC117320744 [Pecten maximus]|uniref:uncharacterized protein LOC117320744 n=1 Tax=Pecten maximus TaxID=6579 RepID=UPI001457FB56|nr:uncharacterized protein LOC117320744 [Pecten maximus]
MLPNQIKRILQTYDLRFDSLPFKYELKDDQHHLSLSIEWDLTGHGDSCDITKVKPKSKSPSQISHGKRRTMAWKRRKGIKSHDRVVIPKSTDDSGVSVEPACVEEFQKQKPVLRSVSVMTQCDPNPVKPISIEPKPEVIATSCVKSPSSHPKTALLNIGKPVCEGKLISQPTGQPFNNVHQINPPKTITAGFVREEKAHSLPTSLCDDDFGWDTNPFAQQMSRKRNLTSSQVNHVTTVAKPSNFDSIVKKSDDGTCSINSKDLLVFLINK